MTAVTLTHLPEHTGAVTYTVPVTTAGHVPSGTRCSRNTATDTCSRGLQ